MRYLLALLALLLAVPAFAGQIENRGTVRGIVFSYECKQANQMNLGFTCNFQKGKLTLVSHERFKEMAPDRRERAHYEYGKLALRFMQLGGRSYIERADYWNSDEYRICSRVDNIPYEIGCTGILHSK